MEIKFGIMAIRPSENEEGMVDILRFCGYEEPLRQIDYDFLKEELANDEELGMVAIVSEIKLVEAPEEIVKIYRFRSRKPSDPRGVSSNACTP